MLGPALLHRKALLPFAEIVKPTDQNLMEGVSAVLKMNSSVLVLADVGTISGDLKTKVEDWVKKGGVLVRFAGPRLENGGDDLLRGPPCGGTLARGRALLVKPAAARSLRRDEPLCGAHGAQGCHHFAPGACRSRAAHARDQGVGAASGRDSARNGRLRGAGQIVLFHVTANSEWSSLPMSGLFVDMLKRISSLGTLWASRRGHRKQRQRRLAGFARRGRRAAARALARRFRPSQGAAATAESIPAAKLMTTLASLEHPPGYYGPAGSPVRSTSLRLRPCFSPSPPRRKAPQRFAYEAGASVPLMPALLTAALALVLADMAAVLLLMGVFAASFFSPSRAHEGARAAMVLMAALSATFVMADVRLAQAGEAGARPSASDELAQKPRKP